MHWLDYQIKLPLPPTEMRWPMLAGISIAWGLVPLTERDLTISFTFFVFPMLTALHMAGYWRGSAFLAQLLIACLGTIAAFTIRTLLAPLYGSVGSLSHFLIFDWSGRGLLLVPLGVQLFMASLTLLPLHFVLRHRHATAA